MVESKESYVVEVTVEGQSSLETGASLTVDSHLISSTLFISITFSRRHALALGSQAV
jgi:hypothetical protein